MSANATTSSGTSHRYSSTGAVMEPIKKEYDVPGVADFDLRGHSAAPVTVYGEASGTRYAQMPNHYYPNQPSSAPLSRKRKAADTHYNQVTTSPYTLEASSLDYSNPSGAGPNSKSSKPRSTKRRKAASKTKHSELMEEKKALLTIPLSQLAIELGEKNLDRKAEVLAIRSSSQRQHDAAKEGVELVKRPFNAFILYRMAYQDVTKQQFGLHNHQEVSSMCGHSWSNFESEDFKSHYRKLADVERLNHARAFPRYRYEPSNKNKDKKDTESSPQPDIRSTKNKKKKARKGKKLEISDGQVLQKTIEEQERLQAKPDAPLPYWNCHTTQTYPAPSADHQYAYPDPKGNHGYPPVYIDPRGLYIYPDPDNISDYGPRDLVVCLDHKELYAYPDPKALHVFPEHSLSQTRCIATPGDKYSAGRISPPLVQGLYGDAAEPYMNYRNGFIDPSILTQKTSMMYDLTNCSVAIQRQWQPVPVEGSPTETFIPGLDIQGSYDRYLKGDDQDWKVEQLDEASHFKDEMAQTEVQSKDV